MLVAIFVLSALIHCRRGATLAKPNSAQPQKNQIVVFALSGKSGQVNMDAVVMVDGKRLQAPYSEESKEKQTKFAEEYFSTRRQYRMTFGGGEAGTVSVESWSEGCNNVHAKGTATGSVRLGGEVRALATNSETLGKRPPARRAPTDVERAALMSLVKNIYAQRRTPANLIRSMKVTNLAATDLDGDGKYEMVGSFTLAVKNKFERDLFLIAKPQGAAMRADFVRFRAYQPPPEGFLSSVDFVDQLDLDGDGVGEVFATQAGFDAYGYLVFKKTSGRWKQVYAGIGDAC
jgi:hypothetical protein